MTVKFSDPKTMPHRVGYSQIAEVTKGKIVLIAGQVPHDTDDKLVGAGDFAAQDARSTPWTHTRRWRGARPGYQARVRSPCWRIHACIAIPAATPRSLR